jgi:hypothetical protein
MKRRRVPRLPIREDRRPCPRHQLHATFRAVTQECAATDAAARRMPARAQTLRRKGPVLRDLRARPARFGRFTADQVNASWRDACMSRCSIRSWM